MSITALRPTVAAQFGQNNKKSLGEKVVDTVENSWLAKQVYKQEKYFSDTPWYLRWKAYGSKENLKAGWDKAMAWFKPKDLGGKALAIVTLAAGIATDFMGHMLIVGIPYTLSKVFFPFMNVSGFATAFHDGVHQAYEAKYLAQHPEKAAKEKN